MRRGSSAAPIEDHRALLRAVEAGRSVVLATVVESERSVPRRAGAKMLVFADGSQSGTIGGGEMESRVIAEALDALANGRPRMIDFVLVDPGRGDPGVCGGTVRIYLEPYMPAPTIYIVGCGHVGRAVAELAAWLGFRVVATDDRATAATPEAVPAAEVVLGGPIAEVLQREPITDQTHVVVVTRNVALDLDILPHLVRTPARSIGVMGSARRWATTRAALAKRDLTEADLARITAPIGLEIAAETPEEIAVSILAEIVAQRRAP